MSRGRTDPCHCRALVCGMREIIFVFASCEELARSGASSESSRVNAELEVVRERGARGWIAYRAGSAWAMDRQRMLIIPCCLALPAPLHASVRMPM